MSLWKKLKYERGEDAGSGVLVLRLEGALSESPESYAFLEMVRAEIQQEARDVILNLAKLYAVTSSGVGVIAAIHSSAASRGKRVCVTTTTPRVEALFKIVHLGTLVPEYASEADGLAALGARSPSG